MNDETNHISREEHGGTSAILKVSVRAWLAIMLIAAVVVTQIAVIAVGIITKNPDLMKIGEPLYTMSGMALAYYFGQQKQK